MILHCCPLQEGVLVEDKTIEQQEKIKSMYQRKPVEEGHENFDHKRELQESRVAKYAAFASMDVEGPLSKLLPDLDFRDIVHENCEQFLESTRHWFFDEIRAWSRTPIDKDSKRKLFWLMGAGGTGKSVISAELLRRGLVSPEEAGCKFIAWYVPVLLCCFACFLKAYMHTPAHTHTHTHTGISVVMMILEVVTPWSYCGPWRPKCAVSCRGTRPSLRRTSRLFSRRLPRTSKMSLQLCSLPWRNYSPRQVRRRDRVLYSLMRWMSCRTMRRVVC